MVDLSAFILKKYPEYIRISKRVIEATPVQMLHSGQVFTGTFHHLLYDPQIIGVKLDSGAGGDHIPEIATIQITEETGKCAVSFSVIFDRTIVLQEEIVLIFSVTRVSLNAGLFKQQYLNRFYKRSVKKNNFIISEFTLAVFHKVVAFFYYPKPVFVVSTANGKGPNSFPVDTCHRIGQYFIFGARHSNRIINTARVGDTIAIGLSNINKADEIYQLGKYAEGSNEIIYKRDNNFDIAVPDVVSGYNLAELTEIFRYGIQDIYLARIVSKDYRVNGAPFLSHIHKFWMLSNRLRKYYEI